MRCGKALKHIQEWLDLADGGPMPPDVRAHVAACPSCRGFITRWNDIELQIRSLKAQAPQDGLDYNFDAAQMAAAARNLPRWELPTVNKPLLAGALASIGIVAVLLWQVASYRYNHAGRARNGGAVTIRPGQTPPPFNPDLPLAIHNR